MLGISILILIISIALLILGISISWTYFRGAPWVPTPMRDVHQMLTMAAVGPDDLVVDLGCGDGRIIVTAARRYGARAVGIEIAPSRYLWCRFLVSVLGLQDRVQVIFGDFFQQDLGNATVITCYLLQKTNYMLSEKFIRELKPGARVVSKAFIFSNLYKVEEAGGIGLYRFNEMHLD